MKRRAFITLLGGAAVSSLAANAQQPALLVVRLLSAGSPQPRLLAAFHRSLKETGYVEGQDLQVEYRFAEGRYDQLPALVANLIGRSVAVIAAPNTPAAQAVKGATSTIPIVFGIGIDPVTAGFVENLNRSGGNATGVYFLTTQLEAKRMQLLHEIAPSATVIGVLVNPNYGGTASQLKDAREGARTLGLELRILNASNEKEIDAAFESAVKQRIGGLLVGSDVLFFLQRKQIAALAALHAIPAIYFFPEFVHDGGLMSYGTSLTETYRLAGIYTGRILKGQKPANLPVQQSTEVEFVINLKTAKALGLTFPLPLLGRADEVIE